MAKLAKLQNSSPTTTSKTGEKLRGRKRDPSVNIKAWETRRAKKRARIRTKTGELEPQTRLIQAAKAIRRGSTKPIQRDVLNVSSTPRSEVSQEARWQQEDADRRTTAIAGDNSGRIDNPLGTVKFIADALKQGDQEGAVSRLLQITARANFEGKKRAADEATEQAKRIRKLTIERVVGGFIAEVNAAMARHGGLPPGQAWTVSSFTISKIVDALTEAGYTAEGFRPTQGYEGK